ncbi:MAG: glycoside hydrolase family 26 protein [Phocaeicola sp.]
MNNFKKRVGQWSLGLLIASTGFVACSTAKQKESKEVEATVVLLKNLKEMPSKGILFGHHDDTLYGIGWEGDEGGSDVKKVCGAYPAVISFDLGHLELGDEKSLDNVSFDLIRKAMIEQYHRGGMSSISWHLRNPETGGDSWDVSQKGVVATILEGGKNHDKFLTWLDRMATFLNSLQTADGRSIPVLFRPWHEHTGSWFWWGKELCTTAEYQELWKLTYNRLKTQKVENILYAYSPGMEPNSVAEYLERYPGDDIIDVMGVDIYQYERAQYVEQLEKSLAILTQVGNMRNKAIAITETGFEAIPDPNWWSGTLLPIIEKYPLSYVLVWRNAREMENHYYAPYPGQLSADDFVRFYHAPKTLFIGDDFQLYN